VDVTSPVGSGAANWTTISVILIQKDGFMVICDIVFLFLVVVILAASAIGAKLIETSMWSRLQ